jgi:hypothetical protein
MEAHICIVLGPGRSRYCLEAGGKQLGDFEFPTLSDAQTARDCLRGLELTADEACQVLQAFADIPTDAPEVFQIKSATNDPSDSAGGRFA